MQCSAAYDIWSSIMGLALTHWGPDNKAAILADDIIKMHILYGIGTIQIQVSLKLVPKGPIDNKAALVQVMAWRRTGDRPLPEPMITKYTDAYIWHFGGEKPTRDTQAQTRISSTWTCMFSCAPISHTQYK